MKFDITINEIMTTDLTTVDPNSPIEEFEGLFKRRGFHHIPVENDKRELVGIISSEDVIKAKRFITGPELLAKHIMTPDPDFISEDKTIMDAVELFLDVHYRALPVLSNDGTFVGIITPYDLINQMHKTYQSQQD